VPADPLLSRELRSLQEELSTSQRERVPPAAPPARPEEQRAADVAEEQRLRDQLREFVDEVTNFFEQAEKNISTHPTESVVGALLVGILIGRLLGRR
jgi:ElaB/YqjD/DUF883 family membrane-anchored ribosome-binding protein